jgi:transcriptional regulator with XRE-family HTH domain
VSVEELDKLPIDGAALRELRLEAGVSLRRIARLTGLSHGHLSKMEKNEEHRPVTPIILRAYEQETGAPLTEGFMPPSGEERRAYLSEAGARKFLAQLAAVAYGQALERPAHTLIEQYRRSCVPPVTPSELDVATLRWLAELLTDEQYSTALAGQVAELLLGWLARFVDAPGAEERLWPVLVSLAVTAARSADEPSRGHVARTAYPGGLAGRRPLRRAGPARDIVRRGRRRVRPARVRARVRRAAPAGRGDGGMSEPSPRSGAHDVMGLHDDVTWLRRAVQALLDHHGIRLDDQGQRHRSRGGRS